MSKESELRGTFVKRKRKSANEKVLGYWESAEIQMTVEMQVLTNPLKGSSRVTSLMKAVGEQLKISEVKILF